MRLSVKSARRTQHKNMCSTHIFKVTYMYPYALICGPSPFYRRERTVKIITAFQVAINSTAEKACQTRGACDAPPINRIEVATA